MSVQIVTLKPGKLTNSLIDRVQKLIQKVSGSPWTHSQMVIDGVMYESTWPKFKKTKNYIPHSSENCIVQNFKTQWAEKEKGAAIAWWEYRIKTKTGYGLIKLFIMLALAKTKPFWIKIGWTPMSIDKIWGDFCSAAVDSACKFAGRDLLQGNEEFTAPGDIIKSDLLEDIK